jgi:pyruvate/2-oxoglutarate dehydrogenase complex dihydrolipoamide acyltransferase (E2) component
MTTTTMETETTTPRANWIELSLVCALFVALALIGIIWEITSGLLTSGIDGIMLLAICLMMGGIFSLMILMMVYQAGVLPFFRAKPAAPAAQKAPAAAPAPAAAKTAASVPATSPAAAPPLQPSHPPAAVEPGYPEPPPAPKPAAKPAAPPAAKPQNS